MKLYLDDDSVRGLLIRLLVADGHDVLTPSDAGLAGAMIRFTSGTRSTPDESC
jgi:hypothetical protein